MLAEKLKVPDELRVLDGPGWVYERKLDGLRCLAVRNGPAVELWSRNHLPMTGRFTEIAAALAVLTAGDFVIDGEVVAFEGERTSFAHLQRPGPGARPVYCAFDLLHLLGRDITALPQSERSALLSRVIAGAGGVLRTVETVETVEA
ncbi:MAG: non-homologous end-joining DNA ligase, partial [Acidimicrobiales bacterium]